MRRTGLGRAPLLVLLALLAVRALPSQELRSFRASRPLAGLTRLDLALELDEGVYRVVPAESQELLYRVDLEFDPARTVPRTRAAPSSLLVTLRGDRGPGFRLSPRSRLLQRGEVRLSGEVEWEMRLALRGAELVADLPDLRITGLEVDASASRTTLRFPTLNRSLCRRAAFRVGAGELELVSFGNSGCREVSVEADFGRVTLDFSGDLPGDVRAAVDLAVGTLALRLPRGTGVRLEADRFLTLFDGEGLLREGDAWISPGYHAARRKIDIRLDTAFARVLVEWVGP